MDSISKEYLEELYIDQGKTDGEIAKLIDCSKDDIVDLRKEYDIKSNVSNVMINYEKGRNLVKKEFEKRNFKYAHMKENKTHFEYDFLLNDKVKVNIFTAVRPDANVFKFSLTRKKDKKNYIKGNAILLPNGRYRKVFSKICDFLIFVGISNENTYFWIIPSSELGDTIQGINFRAGKTLSMYDKYRDAWSELRKACGVSENNLNAKNTQQNRDNRYRKTDSIVSLINYHFIICPVFMGVFNIPRLQYRFKNIVEDICEELDVKISLLECFRDHVHMTFNCLPSLNPNDIIQKIKVTSSEILKSEFIQISDVSSLWKNGYFVSTDKYVSSETIREYVEEQ